MIYNSGRNSNLIIILDAIATSRSSPPSLAASNVSDLRVVFASLIPAMQPACDCDKKQKNENKVANGGEFSSGCQVSRFPDAINSQLLNSYSICGRCNSAEELSGGRRSNLLIWMNVYFFLSNNLLNIKLGMFYFSSIATCRYLISVSEK